MLYLSTVLLVMNVGFKACSYMEKQTEIQSLTCLFQTKEWGIVIFHVNILTSPDTWIMERAQFGELDKSKANGHVYLSGLQTPHWTQLFSSGTMVIIKIFILWCLFSGLNKVIYTKGACKLLSFGPVMSSFSLWHGLVHNKQSVESLLAVPLIHHLCTILM